MTDEPVQAAEEAAQETCSVPGVHQPAYRTVEFHHLVPVAWQLRTPVLEPPSPGADRDGRGELWDDRGVVVCPTHHRNVHFFIVKMMRWINTANLLDAEQDLPGLALSGALTAKERRLHEPSIAVIALQRYVLYGSLRQLAVAGELGQS